MDDPKGQLLKTLPKWGPIFHVEADITVTAIPTETFTNIFHFTQYGDKNPAVFIDKNGFFHICFGINGNKNSVKHFKFEINKKYHMVIKQYEENGKIFYKIEMNGKSIHSIENIEAKNFANVKVYACSPWHNAFTKKYGLLENFKFDFEV